MDDSSLSVEPLQIRMKSAPELAKIRLVNTLKRFFRSERPLR
jgi:hypothetical protein